MKEKDDVLMKNNMLIKARYDISAYENKLFILLLYKLQKVNDTTCTCLLSISEIQKVLNARSVRSKKEISTLLSGLRSSAIYFKKNNIWGEFGFINGYTYNPEEDAFEIEASEKVYSLLREYLDSGYTPINMSIWLCLKSSYSQRFYDLLRLWSNTKSTVEYSVSELRELLMLEQKYTEYRDFKKRVINTAVSELNSTGYFEIDMQENKNGRKVDSISFLVNDLDKRIYFDKPDLGVIDVIYKEPIEIKTDNSNITEFYVPNKKLFTTKTLSNFTSDFSDYDFNIDKYKKMLQEAIMIALEKDNDDKVKVKSYGYFKTVLNNKLNESVATAYKPKSKTKQHNVNSTFDKYKEDELEKVLAESQRDKFNDNRIFIPSFPKPDIVKK